MAKVYAPWQKPNHPTPHAKQVCLDCGKKGCLIPVPHDKDGNHIEARPPRPEQLFGKNDAQ